MKQQPQGVIELLKAILSDSPKLTNAACRDRPTLFDPPGERESLADTAARHQQAAQLCTSCPALAPCTTWRDGATRRQRPGGLIAGRSPQMRRTA